MNDVDQVFNGSETRTELQTPNTPTRYLDMRVTPLYDHHQRLNGRLMVFRYLDETLDRELARSAREGYPVCVIMMDIDHFKQVNDTYGHEAGDRILKVIANTLSTQNRRGDFACRYGGEEFVIVMPNISVQTACQRAEHLRTYLSSLNVQYGRFNLTTTLSIGIACYPSNGENRESVLRAADRALYGAKKAGRNKVITYDHLQVSREKTI